MIGGLWPISCDHLLPHRRWERRSSMKFPFVTSSNARSNDLSAKGSEWAKRVNSSRADPDDYTLIE